jgi:hypothetical protein
MFLWVPGIGEVNFIGDEYSGCFLVFLEEFVPHVDVLKRVLFGDVADEDCELCIFEVGGYEAAVSFLSCCVPHL